MNLVHFDLFMHIVEKGSLAAAGRELGLSPATVTERLASLERHYDVTLLNRTTRAISLTEEGRMLLEGGRQVLEAANELDHRIRRGADSLSGLIRVSAPFDLGRTTVDSVVDKFVEENPAISVELILGDGYVNIVDEGIDLALRLGNLVDSGLRIRRLGENQRVVCASPEYIAKQGEPATPGELCLHNCLIMRFGNNLDNVWPLYDQGKDLQIGVGGNRITNDGRLVHDWCLAGHGIALKSWWDVGADIKSGALVRLLHDYSPPPSSIQMLFPPGRNQPLRVREFSRRLADAFK